MVTSRWLYKLKHAADGNIERYKARFVARGFSQVEGVDYDETFASVARYTSIRSMISIATEMGWKIHQMDVKTAFLNGLIQEEVYIEHPLGFEVHGRESHVCRLKKALYGLKQAPRAWYSRIDAYLQQLGFEKSEVIQAYTSLWLKRILSFSCYMWMIFSLQGQRDSSLSARRALLQSLR
jgi:hypothetical protein